MIIPCLLLCPCGCRSPDPEPEEPPRREHPPDVARAVSPTRSFDHRPYEFIWDPRPPPRIPLIDFDLLIGWTAGADEGVEAAFERSQEEQLWGAYTGRVSYRAPDREGTRLRVLPPEPIRIPGRFDCADVWVYGPGSGCGTPVGRAAPALVLLLRDADEETWRIPMGRLTWGGWEIVHQRLPDEVRDGMRYPLAFAGFLLEDLPPGEEAVVYVDALSFYVEPLAPLPLETRPARNLERWPGLSPGVHRDDPPLPFPVDEQTVIPSGPGEQTLRRVEEVGRHIYDFTCEQDDRSLRYRLNLNELQRAISIAWNGVPVGYVAGGGRILGPQPVQGRLLLARLEADRVRVEFEGGAVYTFGLAGRSLVVDAYSRSEDAEGFSLGRYEGPLQYTGLALPGLGTGTGAWAGVGVLTGGADIGLPPLFISGILDWYRSEASQVEAAPLSGPRAGSFVQTRYLPNTAGERNDLYERAILTLSPRIEDVLPRLAQPAARRAEALVGRIWADTDGPLDYGQALEESRRLASLGLREVLQGYGESCWRDGSESCTLRTRAAPARGGDEALAALVRGQQDLGWRIGLPASYYSIHGLSPFWSPDLLQRDPTGAWRRNPWGHFAVKAPSVLTLQGKVGAVLVEKFAPSFAYLRDAATVPPWTYTDYDARIPGAGTFAQAYYSVGELLLAEGQTFDAPVVCEGGAEAFYVGLTDGYLAPRQAMRPFLPVFYLERINPLACGFGVGPPEAHVPDGPDADRFTDAGLADQIAYGRAGRLAPPEAGVERRCRSYFMMRELQSRYLLQAPLRIAYWDGQAMVSTSEAILGGALARSQLYLHFPADLEIWVNGSADLDWEVRVGRDTWILPPSGWVAAAPGFLEVSARVDGARLDYLKTKDFLYFDGRGREDPFRGWASAGPLAVWFHADADTPMTEVLDIGGTGQFGFTPEDAPPGRVEVFTPDRRLAGTVSPSMEAGRVSIRGPAGPHFYRLLPLESPPAQALPAVQTQMDEEL